MTILLYNHIELDDRPSRHLKPWKACHLFLYALATVFGLVNFICLQYTMQLVNDNCVLFPQTLEFHVVELPEVLLTKDAQNDEAHKFNSTTETAQPLIAARSNITTSDDAKNDGNDANNNSVPNEFKTLENKTLLIGNATHRVQLDLSRSLFETGSVCQFAEFMPILSTIFGALWLTLFTMCAGGGHVRTGLQQPWRIVTPALIFALVMVGLTGHSFVTTNKGLVAFCEAFSDYTNSTTCSSVDPLLERGWNATWGFGGRAAATRAASAAVWAAWACAATMFAARCLAAPDFVVKRTRVCLTKDPHEKIIPHLKKSASSHSSPTKRDTVSMRSEPTVTTELVSASVEPGPDTAPSSVMTTPVRVHYNPDIIEMTHKPNEIFLRR